MVKKKWLFVAFLAGFVIAGPLCFFKQDKEQKQIKLTAKADAFDEAADMCEVSADNAVRTCPNCTAALDEFAVAQWQLENKAKDFRKKARQIDK